MRRRYNKKKHDNNEGIFYSLVPYHGSWYSRESPDTQDEELFVNLHEVKTLTNLINVFMLKWLKLEEQLSGSVAKTWDNPWSSYWKSTLRPQWFWKKKEVEGKKFLEIPKNSLLSFYNPR